MKKQRPGQIGLFESPTSSTRSGTNEAGKNPPISPKKKSPLSPLPEDLTPADVDVVIVLSNKRKRTVSAKWEGNSVRVMAPAAMPKHSLKPVVDQLVRRLIKDRQNKAPQNIDLELRAQQLNEKYFDGRLKWTDIRWVTNQEARHGSCNPRRGTIRISHSLADYPAWVLDYVIVHELAHLLVPNHGPRFWQLVSRYPMTERARGFLIAKDMEKHNEAS